MQGLERIIQIISSRGRQKSKVLFWASVFTAVITKVWSLELALKNKLDILKGTATLPPPKEEELHYFYITKL